MSAKFVLSVNGISHTVQDVDPHTTLLQWLRSAGLTGTKEGCAEGDCGACTVALVDQDTFGRTTYRSINACIALLPMFANRELLTVEGLAQADVLHPVQQAMVRCYGSQCGYCTPGFVMSMFEGYHREDVTSPEKIHDQLQGNLCRCTGYRPIRDAMDEALVVKKGRAEDLFQLRLKKDVEADLPSLSLEHPGGLYFRPRSLEDLLSLLAQHDGAVLVGGATELGVYINKRFDRYKALISTEGVAELQAITKTDSHWIVGGAATLTSLEEALAGEFPAIDKMLYAFASRQIRNRATLAGNLVTASPIGDMPPLLLALDAEIGLVRCGSQLEDPSALVRRTLPIDAFFLGYRKTAMEPGEIVEWVKIPRGPSQAGLTRTFESYKVSKRRELDISIVAAAFVVDRGPSGLIQFARLAFGGVAATPIRARAAEHLLIGKPLTLDTYQEVHDVLSTEATPMSDARSGKDFRVGLLGSLFEKFVLGEQSLGQDVLPHPTSEPVTITSSTHVHGHVNGSNVGREMSHESAIGHVTGQAIYVDDQAHRRGLMLEMWPVMSPHAHAKILRIDVSKAQAMVGVAAVFLASDIPGINDIGAIRQDEPLLAEGEVLFHGQMIAMVVGDSYETCRRAATLVEVDYELLPAIVDLSTAIAQDSYHTQGHRISRGDALGAMAMAPHKLSGTIEIGGQEHFYLESQAAWAERGDDGDVFVCASTQHPAEIQAVISHVLHLPRHKIVVQAPRMGGGFGGKETQGNGFAALAALAAWKLGRPVRIQLDRDLDMTMTGKRHPFRGEYEAGYDQEGHIVALRVTLTSDGGYALDLSESILDRGLFHLDNGYYLPAVEFFGRVAKTNTCSHTAFRGFGGPQGMVVIEEILAKIALILGLPAETVRSRNLYKDHGETNTTHYGQHLDDNRLPKIWQQLRLTSQLDARRAELATFNAEHVHKKRGLAITPVKFGISFTASFLNQAGALVLIYRDGSVQVNHGGTEMGQGLSTKMLGIAMRELGLPADRIRVMKTQTDKIPNTSATAASSGADLNGAAVKNACETLRSRLAPTAAAMIKERFGRSFAGEDLAFANELAFSIIAPECSVPFADVAETAYLAQIPLSATGFYRTPNVQYDKVKGRGRPFHYFAYGAAVTEVEVDAHSGMKQVLRVDILHDVGDSLNPGIDRGQIEGAFVQGMGWLTSEELKWDVRGRLLTHSASTYQIPAIGDAPLDFRVALLADAAQSNTVHGSKAVGEPPLMLAISVREAIRDAIAAFSSSGPSSFELPCPATHEAIWHAIQAVRNPN